MAILHKNISAEGDIHNPKWFSGANNGDVAWRNELGVLESTDELVLPAALNFVDGSVAPPTSNSGDIYVLSSGASVNAGWGTVALGDWVRYDGTTWNLITPQKSTLCYNETTDALNSYDGSTWSAIGSGGGGGASIYTADGTLTGNRTVDLDGNDLTFNNGVNGNFVINGTSNTTGNQVLTVQHKGISSFFLNEDGKIQNTDVVGNQVLDMTNSSKNSGIILNTSLAQVFSPQLLFRKSTSDANGVRITTSSTSEETKWQRTSSLNYVHQIKSGTTTNIVNFFNQGWSNSQGFLVGSGAKVGSENISLQSSTAIKGTGTSGSSLLSLYDNQGTPVKLWDFLDNGNIDLGVDSALNIGSNDLDINGTGTFSLSNGTRSISSNWNTHAIINLNNGNGTTYSLYSGNASTTFDAGQFGIGVGSNIAFRIFNGSSVALGNVGKGSLDTNYNVQTAGATLIGGNLDTKLGTNEISLDHTNYPKLKISNGTNEYWLIEGDGTGATFNSGDLYLWDNTNSRKLIHFLADGNIDFPNLPTSAPTKGMWNDGGTLKIA